MNVPLAKEERERQFQGKTIKCKGQEQRLKAWASRSK